MPMPAIFIDVARREVSAIQLPGEPGVDDAADQVEMIQSLIGGYVDLVERFPNGDVLLVNESRFLARPAAAFFRLRHASRPYNGNAVIIGEDDGGGIQPPRASVAEVDAAIYWPIVDANGGEGK